jgi:zinc transport system ATP-binding protein
MSAGGPGESDALVRVAGASFGYSTDLVLQDISLTIRRHDFLGVVGPSGSGKTSLLRLLLGSRP